MPKRKRGEWDEDSLRAALEAVNDGMTKKRAAIVYNVPRSTLQRHIKTGNVTKCLGRKSTLSKEQEQELCNRIFRLAEVGMPLTSKVLRRSVYTFCVENHIDLPPQNRNSFMVGRKWLSLFLKRWPAVSRRKSQNLNPARAAKLNKGVVDDYFETLRTIMEELHVMDKPHLIYNMDEKGCQLTLHKEPVVFARKGVKRVPFVSPEHAENATVVSCGNALGQVIPPVILFKGKRNKPEYSDNMPPNTKVFMTEKGSMTCETFVKWVHHFGQYKPPGPVLLIFDGAKSHLDTNIVAAADEQNITLLCLPSNCTHELQPMDKSVFRSFEYHWDDELQRYWGNNPERRLTKTNFGLVLSKVWFKATTPSNVTAGFRATGIYPYDPTVIPETAFAPSALSKRPEPEKSGEPAAISAPKISSLRSLKKRILPNVAEKDTPDDKTTSESEGSDEENQHPEISTSFSDILKTPELQAKTKPPPKKALNYRAVKVVKALFSIPTIKSAKCTQNEKQTEKSKPSTSGCATSKKESWYCSLCRKDIQKDMIQCTDCRVWLHEECCGLTATYSKSFFKCPSCEDSD